MAANGATTVEIVEGVLTPEVQRLSEQLASLSAKIAAA